MTINKDLFKELISKQIKKLDDKQFDLEAWKKSTIIILEKIFGKADNRIEAIANLHYDYGSWSLRDTTGKNMTKGACINTGKAILETALDELEIFGAEGVDLQIKGDEFKQQLNDILDDELRGNELRELKKALAKKTTKKTDLEESLAMVIRNFGGDAAATILARIIIVSEVKKLL